MPAYQKTIKYLDDQKVKYELINHKIVYTAFDKAATLKVKSNIIGKTLVMKFDKNLAMVLISGNKNLDKKGFLKTVNSWLKKNNQKNAKSVDFISEKTMKEKFKGMKIGAVPPLGPMFKIPTFVDKSLLKLPKIILNSGDHSFSIKMLSSSFKKAVPEAILGSFQKAKK